MRDQYAGDISDLLKFAFLRAIAGDDKAIGVGWYYNSTHDGLQDGRHREYCGEKKWESLDRALLTAQYLKLRNALPDHLKAIFVVGYHLGMRLGELRKLRWEQVEFESGQIRLSASHGF
jgi:integrase